MGEGTRPAKKPAPMAEAGFRARERKQIAYFNST